MKKIILISLIGLIICTAFVCPQVSISDYRNAYVGKYACHSSTRQFKGGNTAHAVFTDTISITITKDVADSILLVNIRQQTLKVKLINKSMQASVSGSHYGGKFYATDSLFFSFQPSMAVSYKYYGKKK